MTKVATPNAHTVVIDLNRSYNPQFYVDDVLTTIPLMPQHAWDKTSLTGKVGNYDQTTSGAKAVWNFLQKQGGGHGHLRHQPALAGGRRAVEAVAVPELRLLRWVPNKNYSGPDKPILSKVIWTPFTTDTAEMDTLRSGTTLDLGRPPAERRPADSGARGRGLLGGAGAEPWRRRDRAEPLQPDRRARCCASCTSGRRWST